MNKHELKTLLMKEQVSRSLYSLEGGLPADKLCLGYENDQWMVYFTERGIKSVLEIFSREEDACEFLYRQIKSMEYNMRGYV